MSCDSCGCDCQDEPEQVIYGCLCGCEAVDPQPFGRMHSCAEPPIQGPMTAFAEMWVSVVDPFEAAFYRMQYVESQKPSSGFISGLAAWLPAPDDPGRIRFGVER